MVCSYYKTMMKKPIVPYIVVTASAILLIIIYAAIRYAFIPLFILLQLGKLLLLH